jgi:catechol-2,3-dioxygenase
MITRVGSITLEVPDLDASVEFFTEKVGLALTESDGRTAFLRSGEFHHDLILVASDDGSTALQHLNFEVDSDLDGHVARALAAGATDLGPIVHPGVAAAHLIEIPGEFAVKLYTGIATVGAPPVGPIARPYRFSHFNIGTPDVKGAMNFFTEAFGLRPSDCIGTWDDPWLAWMHCPVPRAGHHGVAILQSERMLHHIAFDFEQVQNVADRVDNYVDGTHYLVWGMGRHGTGGSAFAYIEDHSGMMVELDSGMIVIGDDPRWDGPKEWSLDDPRSVDAWGSKVPEAWLAKRIEVRRPRSVAAS